MYSHPLCRREAIALYIAEVTDYSIMVYETERRYGRKKSPEDLVLRASHGLSGEETMELWPTPWL